MRLFKLSEIGIDEPTFLKEMIPTFDKLDLDEYEKKREQIGLLKKLFPEHSQTLEEFLPICYCGQQTIESHFPKLLAQLDQSQLSKLQNTGNVRYRTIAKFEVTFAADSPQIRRVDSGDFVQKCGEQCDLRRCPRVFTEASKTVTDHPDFLRLVRFVCSEVKELNPSAKKLVVTLHQVSVLAYDDMPFELPDGIHHDGADYIVSAIPLVMEDVVVPTSLIYDTNKKKILETKLSLCQGLFHDDKVYWHSVSPLHTTAKRGRRCTIGLDIKIAE